MADASSSIEFDETELVRLEHDMFIRYPSTRPIYQAPKYIKDTLLQPRLDKYGSGITRMVGDGGDLFHISVEIHKIIICLLDLLQRLGFRDEEGKWTGCSGNPGDIHWTTVKNILKYLRNTKDMFLVYGSDIKRELMIDKQSLFATSSAEAEYIAAFDASKESMWDRKFISGLSVVPIVEEPISMYCDNTRGIAIANESRITEGARHFRAKVHYLREVIEFGDIKLEKVHTDDNLADPFTKSLAFSKHSEHTKNIGMLPASSFMPCILIIIQFEKSLIDSLNGHDLPSGISVEYFTYHVLLGEDEAGVLDPTFLTEVLADLQQPCHIVSWMYDKNPTIHLPRLLDAMDKIVTEEGPYKGKYRGTTEIQKRGTCDLISYQF
nr:hypothetical protein [Tanacetum cinerariifolium]